MILRPVLGTLYVAMAVGQLVSWSRMPEILDAYQLPGIGSPVFVAVLIAAELVSGVWLVTRPRSGVRTPVWGFLAVALVWSGLGLQGVLRGLEVPNCGCFGVYLTQRLSWFVLAQDALLLVYALLLVRRTARDRVPAGTTG